MKIICWGDYRFACPDEYNWLTFHTGTHNEIIIPQLHVNEPVYTIYKQWFSINGGVTSYRNFINLYLLDLAGSEDGVIELPEEGPMSEQKYWVGD